MSDITTLTECERLLIEAFRSADAMGKGRIIQVCMNQQDAAEARRTQEPTPANHTDIQKRPF